MSFSPLAAPIQGFGDTGEPCDQGFPVVVAGCDAAGVIAPLLVNADGSLDVNVVPGSGDPSVQGVLTDRSGTLAAGGTAETVMVANANRRYFYLQNISVGDLWINFGVAAVQSQPSIRIEAFGAFVMEGTFISTQSVSIIGATTGQAWTAKEG